MTIAYHASHEQFAPSSLLEYVRLAEKAGFGAISSSDHFHPWSERQGQSGFSFAWLGAALLATGLPYSMVCAPGQRYHPAIVAQAIATLNEMFDGRLSVALGSGEALNESITGDKWPEKQIRNARLLECYGVISRLLNGQTVSHRGLVSIENAKLYTLPTKVPMLFCAAVSLETAQWAGEWADGLLTTHRPKAELQKIINAFRANGGGGKPIYLKVQLSYARDKGEAVSGAFDQWRGNIFRAVY
jgi:coenzyme F420-dependent glucose-6-phosphate dehydrogenase